MPSLSRLGPSAPALVSKTLPKGCKMQAYSKSLHFAHAKKKQKSAKVKNLKTPKDSRILEIKTGLCERAQGRILDRM